VSGTAAPSRWLVLPGLACPPGCFDAVAARLRTRGVPVELDVRDAWRASFLADDLDTVLDGRSYEGVVGHSLGGLLALELALRRPDRVGHVVLVDPTPPGEQGPPAAVRAGLRRLAPVVARVARVPGVGGGIDALLGRRWARSGVPSAGRFRDDLVWQRVWRELEVGWDRARRVDAALSADRPQPRPDLLLPLPVTRRSRRDHERLTALVGARTRYVPGTGHLLMCDRPDVVADVLARAVRATGPDGGTR
jgi:pimeloyl-ACP methyl ester carboxylesterase